VHPRQRARIGRFIPRAIGKGAADLRMNTVHPVNRRHRIIAVAEGRHRNKPCGALQSPVHILAEIGMIQHPLQRVRVEHLQQQRAHPAGHHPDDIGVHQPDRGIAREQRIVRRRGRRLPLAHIVKHPAHLRHQFQTQRFDRIGHGVRYRREALRRETRLPRLPALIGKPPLAGRAHAF